MFKKSNFDFVYKIIPANIFLAGFLLLPLISFADAGNLPCDNGDPYSSPCPLDTWVWVFAVIAMGFGALQLYRRQKTQKQF